MEYRVPFEITETRRTIAYITIGGTLEDVEEHAKGWEEGGLNMDSVEAEQTEPLRWEVTKQVVKCVRSGIRGE